MEEQGSKTQLERVLAALAHGSILFGVGSILLRLVPLGSASGTAVGLALAGIGIGIVVALCIWLVMKGKSDYLRGQALQAVVYQVAVVVVTEVLVTVWGFVWVLLVFGLQIPPPGGSLSLFALPIGFQVLAILYALWGAVRCLGGHDFRYAIVGKLAGR